MPVFKSVSFEIERGERVALVAANGVGKTTLINCIIGKYKLAAGTVKFGYGVKTAYFEQDQARALPPEKTIFEEVREACPRVTDAEIRKVLGAFQYSGNDVFKKIKVLSGGEKNRVAMTKVLLQRANFLILDEPTNHLDLYAEDVLRQALSGYEGTMLFVSHNLNFISQLATHILELTPTGVNSFPGTYEEFCHAKKLKQESIQTGVTPKTHNNSAVEQQKKEQLTRELRKQVTELERTIVRLEGDQIKRSDLLTKYTYGTHEYAQALKRLQGIQKELADTQSEWEKLTEQLK
jgi:ATP-binding cassette subfamily F protein 3